MKIRIIKAPSKSNKYSLGGDFSNGVIQINSGGLHSTNPYEGVQMGVDPQGIPNLVEEGEVIYNDYVFSNRLRVPKEVRQKYKLRGTTFADAAKQLQKESEERPNDSISKKGLEANMQMLMNEQETVRMKKESNKFARGGKLGNLFDGLGEGSQKLNTYSNFTKLSDDSFYTPEYMNFWNWFNSNSNSEQGKKWLQRINSGEFGDIGGNTFNAADISRLAHDYKKGPVHNAFNLASQSFTKESNATPEGYTPYTRRWIREKGADGVWRTQQISDADWNAAPEGRTYLMRNSHLKEGNTVTSDKGDKDIYFDVIPEVFTNDEEVVPTKVTPMKDNWLRKFPIWMSGLSVTNDLFGGNEPDYSNANIFARAIEGTNRPIRSR